MFKPYIHTEVMHNTKAAEVIVPILVNILNPKSVLDVGCGLGTWLKVFQDHGVAEILGVDGHYLEKSKLAIDKKDFIEIDLRNAFNLRRKFDMVVCLEVAEHLPESSANFLIESLCVHSDVILFSAAVPGQGGQNHINEQKLNYWIQKFENKNYKFYDGLRYNIWGNTEVDWWYQQNIYVVSKVNLPIPFYPSNQEYIHPTLYYRNNNELKKFQVGDISLKQLFKVFLNYFKKRFGSIG